MPRDDVDSSLITSECCKRKLTSYITDDDNVSADKAMFVKRLKETINLTSAMLTGATASASKSSTHSSTLEDRHINASGSVHKHTYDVPLNNNKIL
jgi:hypothetical protein